MEYETTIPHKNPHVHWNIRYYTHEVTLTTPARSSSVVCCQQPGLTWRVEWAEVSPQCHLSLSPLYCPVQQTAPDWNLQPTHPSTHHQWLLRVSHEQIHTRICSVDCYKFPMNRSTQADAQLTATSLSWTDPHKQMLSWLLQVSHEQIHTSRCSVDCYKSLMNRSTQADAQLTATSLSWTDPHKQMLSWLLQVSHEQIHTSRCSVDCYKSLMNRSTQADAQLTATSLSWTDPHKQMLSWLLQVSHEQIHTSRCSVDCNKSLMNRSTQADAQLTATSLSWTDPHKNNAQLTATILSWTDPHKQMLSWLLQVSHEQIHTRIMLSGLLQFSHEQIHTSRCSVDCYKSLMNRSTQADAQLTDTSLSWTDPHKQMPYLSTITTYNVLPTTVVSIRNIQVSV